MTKHTLKTKSNKPDFENNWQSKTLEALEKDYWKDPGACSKLILTCHQLRKKQLKDFDSENLRIMITQQIGLKYLVPLALEELNKNILAEGNLYEGDLLHAVLSVNTDFWKSNPGLKTQINEIVSRNKNLLRDEHPFLFRELDLLIEKINIK